MTAAAFGLAALLIPVGATSAVADDYGPDDYPCTIEVDRTVITEGESIQVDIVCSEAVVGTTYLYADDGTVVDQMPLATGPATDAEAASAAAPAAAEVTFAAAVVPAGGAETVAAAMPAAVATEMYTLTGLTAGEYTIEATDTDDDLVAAPVALTVVADSAGTGDDPSDDGNLAATGSTSMPYLVTAGGLLLAGVVALIVTRRARSKA